MILDQKLPFRLSNQLLFPDGGSNKINNANELPSNNAVKVNQSNNSQ